MNSTKEQKSISNLPKWMEHRSLYCQLAICMVGGVVSVAGWAISVQLLLVFTRM